MRTVAVVAHAGKGPEGGLVELRQALAREGVADPLWYEVRKSRKAAKRARRALAQGAEVLFVWGGDGTVQRCIDAVAGTQACWRSFRSARRTSSRRTCGFPVISPRRCGLGCMGNAAGSTPGR